MKPPPFQYYAPASVEIALKLLHEHGANAHILAGGQSLVPDMNFRKIAPQVLIDINGIAELQAIEPATDWLVLGAGVRQSALADCDPLTALCPIIPQVLEYVGYEQTRNRGTLGGSLAYGDPAGELPAMALALDAEFELSAHNRSRWVRAETFYTGAFSTILEPDEMLTRIRIPIPSAQRYWAFAEQPVKTYGKAIVGLALSVALTPKNLVEAIRIAAWGLSDRPIRLYDVETVLSGRSLDKSSLDKATQSMQKTIHPPSDIHASSALRSHIAKAFLSKVIAEVCDQSAV